MTLRTAGVDATCECEKVVASTIDKTNDDIVVGLSTAAALDVIGLELLA